MNKKMKKKRKKQSIFFKNKPKVFHNIKVIYEKAIEVNNAIKLNVDEQQDDINHLKEPCDIEDEYEVQEITTARNR